jgi:hypothetical protein
MNQGLRRISLMKKNGGKKSRDTIPSKASPTIIKMSSVMNKLGSLGLVKIKSAKLKRINKKI